MGRARAGPVPGPAGAPAGPGRVKSGRSRAAERAFARPVFSSPARLAQNGPGKPSCPGPAVSERAGRCAADGPGQDGLPGRFSPRRARHAPRPADLGASAREWQAGPGKARGPGPARARAGPGRGPSRARPGPAPHFANRPVSHPISPTRPRRPQLRAGPGGGGPYWSCPPLARPRATAGDPAAANPPHLHPAAPINSPTTLFPSLEPPLTAGRP